VAEDAKRREIVEGKPAFAGFRHIGFEYIAERKPIEVGRKNTAKFLPEAPIGGRIHQVRHHVAVRVFVQCAATQEKAPQVKTVLLPLCSVLVLNGRGFRV
jgi:hypothetical protein